MARPHDEYRHIAITEAQTAQLIAMTEDYINLMKYKQTNLVLRIRRTKDVELAEKLTHERDEINYKIVEARRVLKSLQVALH